MTATIESGHIIIKVPLQPPTPSGSGKTLIVATNGGAGYDPKLIDPATKKPIKINLFAYVKA